MRHRKPVSQSMRPLGSFLRSKLEFDAGISSHRRVDLVKLLCALNRHLNLKNTKSYCDGHFINGKEAF
jgi:hypothetical protein